MRIPIVPIGNSKGIRIPKSILTQLDIKDEIELEVREKELVLKPVKKSSREAWEKAFTEMAAKDDDEMLFPEFQDEENFEWEW